MPPKRQKDSTGKENSKQSKYKREDSADDSDNGVDSDSDTVSKLKYEFPLLACFVKVTWIY